MQDVILGAFKEIVKDEKAQQVLTSYSDQNDVTMSELGLTSLQIVEVCMSLDDALGLDIDMEELSECRSMAAFIAICQSRIAE